MSLESFEKRLPDSQVQAPQSAGSSSQSKNAQAMERTSSYRSQDLLTGAVVAASNAGVQKSPKLATARRKSMTKKPSVSSNKSKQKAKLKKQSTASTGHSDSVSIIMIWEFIP